MGAEFFEGAGFGEEPVVGDDVGIGEGEGEFFAGLGGELFLDELEAEGGIAGRAERYRENYRTLVEGMRALGFQAYLAPELQGYIITSFRYPTTPGWDFETFYARLNERDFVIYPGKVSDGDCFRIGNIGRIFAADVKALIAAIRDVLMEMNVTPGA